MSSPPQTPSPRIGIIGGSGLGNALLATNNPSTHTVTVDTPFGNPSAPITLASWQAPGTVEGVPIAFLPRHGIGHTIPPSAVPYRANVWALKALGCRWIIASGAVGSLREEIAPRDLILIDQLIDKTTRRPSTFFEETGGGAVHVEFAEPVCPVLRKLIFEAAEATNLQGSKLHPQGTYICMEGPAFSTRAESLMHRQWGGDLIGMTALPEAKLAREAEISYALIALATDYDCWKPHAEGTTRQALLAEIIGHMHAATANALALLQAAVPHVWAHRTDSFPAHAAHEQANWTDKSKIPPATRPRLDQLWGRYF
jgi:5'-methylthioadenosine phosphorylase